jgi:polyphosphate kinase
VRLEIDGHMPERIRDILTVNLELAPYQVYTTTGPLGLSDLAQLAALDYRAEFPLFSPTIRHANRPKEDIFTRIAQRDIVLYHPYDSFDTVLDFLGTAPRTRRDRDQANLVSGGAPPPRSCVSEEARGERKAGGGSVELKARFDEENNIVWAQELEEAGVPRRLRIVGLKTHAKMTLCVRARGGRHPAVRASLDRQLQSGHQPHLHGRRPADV